VNFKESPKRESGRGGGKKRSKGWSESLLYDQREEEKATLGSLFRAIGA